MTRSAAVPAARPLAFVDLAAQYQRLKADVDTRVMAVLAHGQYILGPEVEALERALADYVGVKHAIGMADGTTALLAAMMALDIGPGDEVITTPFTFIATAEMIALLGATPVFVDIDPATCNIDAGRVEAAITPNTKAILPVSLYGQCAALSEINQLAACYGIPVVEDGAQSFGATHGGRRSCSMTTIACTSFFPSKPLGCYGDGGACFTDDDGLAVILRQIRSHGQARRYEHVRIGLNARLDTLQAAVLLAKLDRFDEEIELRNIASARYGSLLSDLPVTLPSIASGNTSVFAQYTIRLSNRELVAAKLRERGIPTAVHYPVPLHRQPVFGGLASRSSLENAEEASRSVLSLPMSADINAADQEFVAATLAEVLG